MVGNLRNFFTRLLLIHLISLVSLELVATISWLVSGQQFDFWVTSISGFILLELLMSAGVLSSWLTIFFAFGSNVVERRIARGMRSSTMRRTQRVGYVVILLVIAVETWNTWQRGHNTYAFGALALTLTVLYCVSLFQQSHGRTPQNSRID